MNEKEKRKLRRKIILAAGIVLAVVLVYFVVNIFLPDKAVPLSEFTAALTQQLDADPNNAEKQRHFVLGVVREQESIPFNAVSSKKKNPQLISRAIKVAEQFLENGDDRYIQLALARLYFQNAGLANISGNIVKATMNVSNGIDKFDELTTTQGNTLMFRAYRAINYLSIPAMFGKRKEGLSDFLYVADAVLQADFELRNAAEKVYHRGMIVFCLETALEIFTEEDEGYDRITQGHEKILRMAEEEGIDLNNRLQAMQDF